MMLAIEVDMWCWSEGEWTDLNSKVEVKLNRGRRSLKSRYKPDPKVYLRNTHQHKARDKVLSALESILIWPTVHKNVEWIN